MYYQKVMLTILLPLTQPNPADLSSTTMPAAAEGLTTVCASIPLMKMGIGRTP